MLLEKELTETIIGLAIEVHKTLGAGFLEAVYEEALSYEFKQNNIQHERQKELDIYYKEIIIPKKYKADFIVNDIIILELKAKKNIDEIDEAQLFNYLKATKLRIGLLLNFGCSEKLKIKRKIYG